METTQLLNRPITSEVIDQLLVIWADREIEPWSLLSTVYNVGDYFAENVTPAIWAEFVELATTQSCSGFGRHLTSECTTECGDV